MDPARWSSGHYDYEETETYISRTIRQKYCGWDPNPVELPLWLDI